MRIPNPIAGRRASGWRSWTSLAAAAFVLVAGGWVQPRGAEAAADLVVPIDWAKFAGGLPPGEPAEAMRRVLANATKYATATWYPQAYGGQHGEYLDFGGIGESQIRPAASEALAMAAALKTGAYDADYTGVSRDQAERITLRLVESLAHRHRATSPGTGWGDHWQSALWAYWAGSAGWFMWDELSPSGRAAVQAMVRHEADRFVGYEVPYYRDVAGDVVTPGDTKAEENAWNGLVLQLATAMMPRHPHWTLWMDKCLELMVSAYARPQDVQSQRRINGKTVSQWLDGSNAGEDAMVVNHGIIHPEYLTPVSFNAAAAQSYTLAGMQTPEAAFFNVAEVYDALVDLEFPSPPYASPGGTIYVDGSSEIYYPQGSDWGTGRRMIYAWLDIQAATYRLDGRASTPAATWAGRHTERVLQMQARFDDGRTFGAWDEHRYAGREQMVAVLAAQAYLVYWIEHQGGVRLTDRAYPVHVHEAVVGDLTLDLPDRITPGRPVEVSALFENDGRAGLRDVEVRIELPAGWTASRPTWSRSHVEPGRTVTATFEVTAPLTATPQLIAASASFSVAGERRVVSARPKSAPLWASPDGAMFLVGQPDHSSAEFALSPNGHLSYPQRFPADVTMAVGADPRTQWSYIQPGPRDRWAGSRPHPFTLRFHLDEVPQAQLVYTSWLLDTHHQLPPRLTVDLNGRQVTTVQLTAGGGDGYHWGDGAPPVAGGVRPASFGVALPREVLRPGLNELTLTTVSGSWAVYDAFGIQRTPA
jgi:hypothetical protein